MRDLAMQALDAFVEENEAAVKIVKAQMERLVERITKLLPEDFPSSRLTDLRRHVAFGMEGDYRDILRHDLTDIEQKTEEYVSKASTGERPTGFDDLLHPLVQEAAIGHFRDDDYRNAVLDAVIAVFDKIRERTGLDLDGDRLCTHAFSVDRPYLIVTEIKTESGRNEQIGFMELCKGMYRGVRNPKAHSLAHDLDMVKAAQYLVLASILMRRVMEATSAHGNPVVQAEKTRRR